MEAESRPEQKSINSLAFEHYLRTGQRFTAAEFASRLEAKYNHSHGPDGRFSTGLGNGVGANGRGLTSDQPAILNERIQNAIFGNSRANPFDPISQFPNMPLREIQGYPQSGKGDWRSKNDVEFRIAATFYNARYHLKPGDQGYRTPEFLKAWAMIESGSDHTKSAFLSDPFQVNNLGDYPKNDDAKFRIAYLRPGQKMTPAVSAIAALEWLRFKGRRRDKLGRVVEVYSDEIALQNYNGRNDKSDKWGNVKHKEWYAAKVISLVKTAPRLSS